MRKNVKSPDMKQTLAEINSAHCCWQTKCQLVVRSVHMFKVLILPYRALAGFPLFPWNVYFTLLGVSVDIFWNHTLRQWIKPSVFNPCTVLSVRFEVGVSLLLAPVRADKRGPKFSSNGYCRNTAGDSQESTWRSSGGSKVLMKALLVRVIRVLCETFVSVAFSSQGL